MNRILVTGTHRSGTTWVGNMLSCDEKAVYIQEPFNIDYHSEGFELPINYWFTHYPDIEDQAGFHRAFSKLLALHPKRSSKEKPLNAPLSFIRDLKRSAKATLKRSRTKTVLVKDPIALLSAEELASTYQMKVVCMIRHPLPFCSSIKKWNWAFPFDHFTQQPLLMSRYFENYREEIHSAIQSEQDLVNQGILLWNLFHEVIKSYQDHHPDWVFLRHEDVTENPVESFSAAYQKLGLEFTQDAKDAVIASTRSSEGETKDVSYKARDKEAVINTWKDRLTEEEAHRIEQGTAVLREHFYPTGLPGGDSSTA